MMDELNIAFSEYIKELKNLDVLSKRKELIESIKQMIVIFQALADSENIELHYLKSNEILDLNNSDVSEDDFIEAAIVYLEVAKNLIGEYLENKI